MAAKAIARRSRIAGPMTGSALHRLVRTRKREIGAIMVEHCRRPDNVAMTGQAFMAKLIGLMVWTTDSIEFRGMASEAITR